MTATSKLGTPSPVSFPGECNVRLLTFRQLVGEFGRDIEEGRRVFTMLLHRYASSGDPNAIRLVSAGQPAPIPHESS